MQRRIAVFSQTKSDVAAHNRSHILLTIHMVLQAGRKHVGEQFEIFQDENRHTESMPKQRLATQVQRTMLSHEFACCKRQLYVPASSFCLTRNDARLATINNIACSVQASEPANMSDCRFKDSMLPWHTCRHSGSGFKAFRLQKSWSLPTRVSSIPSVRLCTAAC